MRLEPGPQSSGSTHATQRIPPFASRLPRSRLLDLGGPAALPGGTQTVESLAANLTGGSVARSRAAALARQWTVTARAARLSDTRPTANLQPDGVATRAARDRSRAALLSAITAASTAGPAELGEVAAERTGQAVADAAVASFERLIPGIVSRALAEAERRLIMAI